MDEKLPDLPAYEELADVVMYVRPQRRVKRRPRLQEVVYTRPRCPKCGGIRLYKYRSICDQGDGTALWWVRCLDESCGHRFRVLLE